MTMSMIMTMTMTRTMIIIMTLTMIMTMALTMTHLRLSLVVFFISAAGPPTHLCKVYFSALAQLYMNIEYGRQYQHWLAVSS